MPISIRVFVPVVFLIGSLPSINPNQLQHSGRTVCTGAFGRCQQLKLCLSTPWCYHYTQRGKCRSQSTAQPKQTHSSTGIHGIWFRGQLRYCNLWTSVCGCTVCIQRWWWWWKIWLSEIKWNNNSEGLAFRRGDKFVCCWDKKEDLSYSYFIIFPNSSGFVGTTV